MKKRTLKAIACAAVMALTLSVTACGGSDAKTGDDANAETTEEAGQGAETDAAEDTSADTESDAAEDTTTDTETDATEDSSVADTSVDAASYATLEDYYNDPTVKSLLDASFESMSQEGMTLSIDVKENVLTMTCKFEDSSVTGTEVGDKLSAAIDANAAQFEQIVASFDTAISQDAGTCTFVVRYTDAGDNVLAEKEFKAQ